jgi:hypothetical protein
MNLEERCVTGAVVSTFTLGPSEHDAHPTAGLAPRVPTDRCLGAAGMGTLSLADQIAVDDRPVALSILTILLHAQTTVANPARCAGF